MEPFPGFAIGLIGGTGDSRRRTANGLWRRVSPATSQVGAQGFPATPFQLSGAWSSRRATLHCFWARTAYPRKKRRAVAQMGRREAALRQWVQATFRPRKRS